MASNWGTDMQDNDNEKMQKRVAFYNNLVNAWIQTRMEVDKTLIVISSAGIGFLITLLAKKGVDCITELVVYMIAFFAFFITIALCIFIFHRNSSYIQNLLNAPDTKANDALLDVLDWAAKLIFALAMIFTLVIGVSTGVDQYYRNKNRKGGQEMAKDSEIQESNTPNGSQKAKPETIKKSLSGLGGLGELHPDSNTGNTVNTDSGQSPKNQSSNDKK